MNVWHVSSLVCTLISLLLLIIALGSDYWVSSGIIHAGLWKICSGNGCSNWGSNIGGHIYTTRACTIIGMLNGFVSTGLLCALFGRTQIGSFSITKNAAYFNYSAGLFAVIAMSVFTGVEKAHGLYSWSFGLGWTCCPLFFIAGGLAHRMFFDAPTA